MKEFLIYTAQVALLVSLCYLIYRLVFARDAMHRLKRTLLLSMFALSFALPLLRITTHRSVVVERAPVPVESAQQMAEPIVTDAGAELIAHRLSELGMENWMFLIALLYVAGVVAVVLFRSIGVVRVQRLLKSSMARYSHNGIPIFVLPGKISPFSFGRSIVISKNDYQAGGQMIIRHEEAHVKAYHYLDLIVVNMALAMQWFNPFMWLMKSELLLAHEYWADRAVLKSGVDAKQYQYLLISKVALANGFIPEANRLCSGSLAKRIRIMKRKTSKLASLKLVLMLPLIGLALAAFAETKYDFVYSDKNQSDQDKERVKSEKEGQASPVVRGAGVTIVGIGDYSPKGSSKPTHKGMDIVPTNNDTVYAPFDGVVKSAMYDKTGYGNVLKLDHSDARSTLYAHLKTFLVSETQKVKAGTPIAIMGSTGKSTGTHLHFEYFVNGEPARQDSYSFALKSQAKAKKGER